MTNTQPQNTASATISIVQIPDAFPEKWDLADIPPDGFLVDDLRRLITEAQPVSSDKNGQSTENNDAADMVKFMATAERLALLDDAISDKQIAAEAKAFGIRVGTLRKKVEAIRSRLAKERRKQEQSQPETSMDFRGRIDLEVIIPDLPDTALALAELLAGQPMLFDRGRPARLVFDNQRNGLTVELLTVHGVVNECHRIARPFVFIEKSDGSMVRQPVTLSERVAKLYLDRKDKWRLRPLNGISFAPLLSNNGSIQVIDGYDPATGLWCEKMPPVKVPENPTRLEAEAALMLLRKTFRTFAFADAKKIYDPAFGVQIVALAEPPGEDESAALAAILTAVCRPSLWLAPAVVMRAPAYSGAGTGKGLLARALSATAYGTKPEAMTAGGTPEEFEKRISAALIGAAETLFLDNINGATLKSDVLASVLTERPCNVRPLGKSIIVPLNTSTLILITGNGLSIAEDMARRCILIELDAGIEDPEQRPFKGDFVEDVLAQRGELLEAALTIWRWGRQNEKDLKRGQALGSYSQWCRWVRDPLLTLGCCDPAERIAKIKADDPRRRAIAEFFNTWWDVHRDSQVTVALLTESAKDIIDSQRKGRQYQAAYIRNLEGTRAAGFVLIRHATIGKWSADKYQLHCTDTTDREKSIGSHGGSSEKTETPKPPMPTYGSGTEAADTGNDRNSLADIEDIGM